MLVTGEYVLEREYGAYYEGTGVARYVNGDWCVQDDGGEYTALYCDSEFNVSNSHVSN